MFKYSIHSLRKNVDDMFPRINVIHDWLQYAKGKGILFD